MTVIIERGSQRVEVNREAESHGPVLPSVATNASPGLDRLSLVKNIVQGLRAIIGPVRSTDRDREIEHGVDLARGAAADLDPARPLGSGRDRVPGEKGNHVPIREAEEEAGPILRDVVNLAAGINEERDLDPGVETDPEHVRRNASVRSLTFPGARGEHDLDLGIIENHDRDQGSRIIGRVRNRRRIGTGIEPDQLLAKVVYNIFIIKLLFEIFVRNGKQQGKNKQKRHKTKDIPFVLHR